MQTKMTSDSVTSTLNELILLGELAPGTIISEVGLAKQFGVSRTPVREAIRKLSETGLVTLRPRQRPIVSLPSIAEALDQFEALAMLEADCCELAARRRTSEAMAQINSLNDACHHHFENRDVESYFKVNEEFHRSISEASNNTYLSGRAIQMRQRLRSLRAPRASEPDRMKASYAEHKRIVETVEANDPERARSAMLEHVAMVGERAADFIRSYTKLWEQTDQ
ncbi:GntR family transcriptional regulator [Paracoccus saliphilus]|uniref:DNA-binding transcriptional regulator, GntR family n=1 Tax=Paracoccus saliphilus TaxID=405559 RepID=A0AA45W7W3_9RHOB|nr:GntR family transcriptional regulator [Paracoccus saliphilus]WCR01556.1 GntR family transcriptional regulator [Paracoccus saliphilus]SIT12452.1 DNA-binding transcriptional regulator, GntR family [Paracoccus saliphilus]